jgi:hypothetical protein
MFEAPDIRPLSVSNLSAANRRHDEMLANSPWFGFGSSIVSVASHDGSGRYPAYSLLVDIVRR